MPLHFHLLKDFDGFVFCEFASLVRIEKGRAPVLRSGQDHVDVVVAGGPWIAQEFAAPLFKARSDGIAQPVERFTQGMAPLLIPFRAAAGITSTIAVPSLDAVGATPGGTLPDFRLHHRWIPV